MSFEDVPQEVNTLFLLELDYPSIQQACRTTSWLRRICQNPYFWQQKLDYEFGPGTRTRKLPNMNYEQYYVYLDKARILRNELSQSSLEARLPRGSLDSDSYLNGLIEGGVTVMMANYAAMKGRLDLLDPLEQMSVLPDQLGADWALENGHQEVVNWLAQRGVQPTPSRLALLTPQAQ